MSKYIIVTDSASDINAVQEKEWETPVLPLKYLVNDTLYVNNPDHSEYPIDKFYEALKDGAKCSTSAVNTGDAIDFLTPYLNEGNDVLYISFSSGLSATYQNGKNAIEELKESFPERKIMIVDSLCASFGQGFLVYLCALKKKEGATIEEVAAYAEETKHRVCHEFTVDDLGQLKRGGRISPTAAFFGSMLQIKPMLFVTADGHLAAYEKVRGRRISMRKLADMISGEIADGDEPIFISHGDCADEVDEVVAMIKEKHPERKFVVNYIGPVIGAHSGYKTIAVFCLGENRGDARLK